MSKLIISMVGLLLVAFSHQAHAQLSVNIKNKIEAAEGINVLRHGSYNYQVGVESGKLTHAYYGNSRMSEIQGDSRIEKISELLGARTEVYEDLSCECLSLWQFGDTYTIFEVNDEARREDYTLHYHIIKE